MKKYTIKDKSGTKKTIYAKDLSHALKIADSKMKDVVSNYFYFDLHDLSMSLDNAINIMKNCGLTIVKINKNNKEAKVYYRGTSAAEQKAADKLDIYLDDSINDAKTKDEANLPTTIQALVNDEEAAIKAYEVAIKNLEGKIDETQMQVLINIMKDERRHIENLYAILNNQVTQKNLEDSKVKDEIITIGNTEYRLYSRYGSYHLDELKTNDRVADFDTYSEAMSSIRQWKKLGYVTDFIDDKNH